MPSRQHERLKLTPPAGGVLVGDLWFDAEPSAVAVLFVPGFGSLRLGSKAEALAAVCARRGWTFATFDLCGHGDSYGTLFDLRAERLQEDLAQVRIALEIRGINKLCIVGSSMGGWAGCWFTLRNPHAVLACAAIAPAVRFLSGIWERLDDEVRQDWKTTGSLAVRNDGRKKFEELSVDMIADAERFSSAALAEGWTKPLMIVHGLQDEVIPFQDALDFVARIKPEIPVELRLLQPGDHRLLDYKDDMAEAICAFFARYLPSQG